MCNDHALHGTCCHLLAAAQLPEFGDLQLVPSALPGEGDGDQVGCMTRAGLGW